MMDSLSTAVGGALLKRAVETKTDLPTWVIFVFLLNFIVFLPVILFVSNPDSNLT
jgi:hypothetical protein